MKQSTRKRLFRIGGLAVLIGAGLLFAGFVYFVVCVAAAIFKD
jgi:hypothetical protein